MKIEELEEVLKPDSYRNLFITDLFHAGNSPMEILRKFLEMVNRAIDHDKLSVYYHEKTKLLILYKIFMIERIASELY